jgi:ankyrin repeat protein
MFTAAYTGCYEAAEFLVKKGANVRISATIPDVKYDVEENPMPLRDVAPLHAVAILSNRDVDTARKLFTLLAEAGANADVIDADAQKPEHYANPVLLEEFRTTFFNKGLLTPKLEGVVTIHQNGSTNGRDSYSR